MDLEGATGSFDLKKQKQMLRVLERGLFFFKATFTLPQ